MDETAGSDSRTNDPDTPLMARFASRPLGLTLAGAYFLGMGLLGALRPLKDVLDAPGESHSLIWAVYSAHSVLLLITAVLMIVAAAGALLGLTRWLGAALVLYTVHSLTQILSFIALKMYDNAFPAACILGVGWLLAVPVLWSARRRRSVAQSTPGRIRTTLLFVECAVAVLLVAFHATMMSIFVGLIFEAPALETGAIPPRTAMADGGAAFRVELAGVDREKRAIWQAGPKVTVAVFWATWCSPCRHEMPSVAALNRKYAGRPVRFVLVSIDNEAPPEKVKQVRDKLAPGMECLLDPNDAVWRRLGVPTIPTTILLDSSGKPLSIYRGGALPALEADILKALRRAEGDHPRDGP